MVAIVVLLNTESSGQWTSLPGPWHWTETQRLTVAGSGSEWRQVSNSLPRSDSYSQAGRCWSSLWSPSLLRAEDQELPPPSETASSSNGRVVFSHVQWLNVNGFDAIVTFLFLWGKFQATIFLSMLSINKENVIRNQWIQYKNGLYLIKF